MKSFLIIGVGRFGRHLATKLVELGNEVMVVDNIVAGIIRKEKLSVSEIEDAIQSNADKGSIGLINSLAELFVDDKITLDQAKSQIEEKNIEILNRTIMQLKIKKGR